MMFTSTAMLDVPVTIIPRYGCVLDTLKRLDDIVISIGNRCTKEAENVSVLTAKIARANLYKLTMLRDVVDLIALNSVQSTILDNEYKSISSVNLNTVDDFVIYSPTAIDHPGKMSQNGKSDATYPWMIFRYEEPVEGDNPVTLLLQFIKAKGVTSDHYHHQTTEFFLPLVGKTLLCCHDINNMLPKMARNMIDSFFTKVMPKTAHQLRALNEPAINLLCMKPYDPDLKDHYYSK